MNRFLVVAVGRNCGSLAARCLVSLHEQTDPRVEVCVVDDASNDPGMALALDIWEAGGGPYASRGRVLRNAVQRYALANQRTAWTLLEPEDDDVVVFVDLDDRLARTDALEVVRTYYEAGALMTYGSYRAVPETHPNAANCRPARPYPPHVTAARAYRTTLPWFNHLRTVSWRVLKHLTTEDLQNDDGTPWRANTDRAVMVPCLEMAGHRCAFVSEVLYEYTCDSPDAVWRSMNEELVRECAQLRARPRKGRLE